MEAIEKTIEKVLEKYNLLIDENTGQCAISDIDFNKIASEIAEHFEEFDKWKLENCVKSADKTAWILVSVMTLGGGHFTNVKLYQYWKDNYKK